MTSMFFSDCILPENDTEFQELLRLAGPDTSDNPSSSSFSKSEESEDPAFAELLRLAANAETSNSTTSHPPIHESIERWQTLFNYDEETAVHLILIQRQDVMNDSKISDDHWELIHEKWEGMGYDREAYEHELRLEEVLERTSGTAVRGEGGEEAYVFRLGGLLDGAEKVSEIVGKDGMFRVVDTESEGERVKLCVVGREGKEKIQEWLRSRKAVQ